MNAVHRKFVDDALEFLGRPDDSNARNGAADQFRIALEHRDDPALARAAGLEQFHVERGQAVRADHDDMLGKVLGFRLTPLLSVSTTRPNVLAATKPAARISA